MVVGVRVRPYNKREEDLGATLCIDMQGTATIITSPAGVPQTFSFDQSFWSHDEFNTEEDGYCSPIPGGRYADQMYVFQVFGTCVLDNAWTGYHCCLFAYGQTGAGKSYSMVGYGTNKGIVPISCEEIFTRISNNTNADKEYEVCVSMMEIYNEAVQDLLVPMSVRPKGGLNVRENKVMGIYVEGVVKSAVDSYEAIQKAVDEGTSNRSVGSTAMNATSSRAHTVITIEFKQTEKFGSSKTVKISNINLIDLAGSEKSSQTGATGDRLKEGNAINKSLSALGNVIEKLAEKSQNPKKKDITIPYRDSKLTRLLQNALGGTAKTIMICALSPASSNFEETLSTLRYADRAKKIKNAAVVNENPQEKLIREMREENEKLKAMVGGAGGGDPEALTALQEEIAELQRSLEDSQKSFKTKLDETKKRKDMISGGIPMIVNINQDMLMSGKIRYQFPEGKTLTIGGHLGESDSDIASEEFSSEEDVDDDLPDIELLVKGVKRKHVRIQNVEGTCFISCFAEATTATWINGESVREIVQSRGSNTKQIQEIIDEKSAMFLTPSRTPDEQKENDAQVGNETADPETPLESSSPAYPQQSMRSSLRRSLLPGENEENNPDIAEVMEVSFADMEAEVSQVRGSSIVSETLEAEPSKEAETPTDAEAEASKEAGVPDPEGALVKTLSSKSRWLRLTHCDRIVMGKAIYLYIHPREGNAEIALMSGLYSYAKARKELPTEWKRVVTTHTQRSGRLLPAVKRSMGSISLTSIDAATRMFTGSCYGGDAVSFAFDRSCDDSDGSEDSSLGEDATGDEVLNHELKNEIVKRERRVNELSQDLRLAAYEVAKNNDEMKTFSTKMYSAISSEEQDLGVVKRIRGLTFAQTSASQDYLQNGLSRLRNLFADTKQTLAHATHGMQMTIDNWEAGKFKTEYELTKFGSEKTVVNTKGVAGRAMSD